MRDAKVANELYVLLLNKAQEMQVLKSGTIGNVRIVDTAILAEEPVSPKLGMTVGLSLFLGLALGIGVAFVRKALDQGVEDPEVIERETGLSVYATVPHSAAQGAYSLDLRKKKKGTTPVLALAQPNDLAVEALRSLRTSLQFALADASNNVVAIGGPSPGIGKSFVSVNLAHVLADAGKRVLLVDADLRKGRLHYYFGGGKAPGLADVICGSVSAKDAVRKTGVEKLHFLAMGEPPPNPSELLSSGRFEDLVEWASREYDLVIIDTAPILAVTDAAIAGRTAGTNLLVLRAGQHPMREIALAVKRMAQNGVAPRALILNDVMPKAGGYAYSKYGYHYHYEYK
jgi:tyrosine-protein kinase Etk/Wzc